MFKRATMVLVLTAATFGLGLPGCAAKTQRTPSLTQAPPKPPKKNYLKEAGDATWSVVTAPAKLIPTVKKPPPEEPETFEPAGIVIIRRNWGANGSPEVVESPAEVTPASQPPSAPSAATKPGR